MHHYIIQHLRRRKDQPVIKGEGAAGGTAAPAGLLVADRDAGVVAAGEGAEIFAAFGEVFPGCLAVAAVYDFHALCGFGGIIAHRGGPLLRDAPVG